MANIVSHGACGVKWTQISNQTGHCSGCCETFSSLVSFDTHQSVINGKAVCKSPSEVRLGGEWLVGRPDRNTGTTVWGKAGKPPPRLVTSTTPVHAADDSSS